jgi:required for meiotic nuclear division protein 1
MASKTATGAAFGSIAKRGLTTHTPTRHRPSATKTLRHPHPLSTTAPRLGKKLPQNHFTSNNVLRQQEEGKQQDVPKQPKPAKEPRPAKGKATRSQAATPSLSRVAVEAQRTRNMIQGRGRRAHVDPVVDTKNVTAFCAAEKYGLDTARELLTKEGYVLEPFDTELSSQVLHVQTPNYALRDEETGEDKLQGAGDVFVFPSGCVVTWNVPEKVAISVVERILLPAAINSHVKTLEEEKLDYIEDPSRDHSKILGDTIILGTKYAAAAIESTTTDAETTTTTDELAHKREIAAILTKIAFSSALARSTKLAYLENLLESYQESTRSIPTTLSAGSKLRFKRPFILRKTGELLHIRAQLNLYSELTDSLPDLFWDSPHELKLETYYDQAGRALDVGVRIKVLNQKMDYASEIATVLRERLSEKHSNFLEVVIIVLIAWEVIFDVGKMFGWDRWVVQMVKGDGEKGTEIEEVETKELFREWLEGELAVRRAAAGQEEGGTAEVREVKKGGWWS